ncbi:hypothetical protein [Klenkia taihuensis]|uniref:Uncharacterized protein n=1 Tax=Klenkia taihuensis TaxID=1225127 RepID=A0A1I1P0A0_9ACTN|nr:hypothetical protein [Klenkia taihuensis]GHE11805.1 hypothetical protein GCM10011381_26840 [Klenkia taihuensis]SFC99380.1 hypothetical protein SAMN05661030_2209 [Klenkia taihuensis]
MSQFCPGHAPQPRTPGVAVAAAVLGFVDAASVLSIVVFVLAGTAASGTDGAGAAIALGSALALAVAAVLLLGSLALLRGTGRTLLVVGAVLQIAVTVALAVAVLVAVGDDPFGFTDPLRGVVIGAVVVSLATPVVRLVLVLQRSVATWLTSRRAAAPVWQPETGQWVTPRRAPGPALAVLAPVGALAVATVLVLATAPGTSPAEEASYGWFAAGPIPGFDPYATDPYATDPYGLGYGPGEPLLEPDTTQYADLYQDGAAVPPPATGDPEYDEQLDPFAQSCFDGAVGSCDDLYYSTPGGTFYEWYGSTCGGRLDALASGTCIYVPFDED